MYTLDEIRADANAYENNGDFEILAKYLEDDLIIKRTIDIQNETDADYLDALGQAINDYKDELSIYCFVPNDFSSYNSWYEVFASYAGYDLKGV